MEDVANAVIEVVFTLTKAFVTGVGFAIGLYLANRVLCL